jgi:hypothetical protein
MTESGTLASVSGVYVMLTAQIGTVSPCLCQLEDELPDAITDTIAEEDTLATEAGSALA